MASNKQVKESFLFDVEAWLGGTLGMTATEKGAYLELLILQFKYGHFSLNQAIHLLGDEFGKVWDVLKRKFVSDGDLYYNVKMGKVINKRKRKTKQSNEWNEVFIQCRDFYLDWHVGIVGFKPQIDGSDMKALKLIIGFFYSIDENYENVHRNFCAVLSKYQSWDKFDKTQTRLRQINSRLTNIINHLKNGKKSTTSQGLASALARRIKEKQSY